MINSKDVQTVFNILKSRGYDVKCQNKAYVKIEKKSPEKIYNINSSLWAEYLSCLAFPGPYNKEIRIQKVIDCFEYLLANDYINVERNIIHNYMIVNIKKIYKGENA